MSFFNVNTVTSPMGTWEFVGLQNYLDLFQNPTFRIFIKNMMSGFGFLLELVPLGFLYFLLLSCIQILKGKDF